MELAIVLICLVVFFTWYINGLMNTQSKREQQALDDYYDALEENRKADELLSDYERVERVQDHFNS